MTYDVVRFRNAEEILREKKMEQELKDVLDCIDQDLHDRIYRIVSNRLLKKALPGAWEFLMRICRGVPRNFRPIISTGGWRKSGMNTCSSGLMGQRFGRYSPPDIRRWTTWKFSTD